MPEDARTMHYVCTRREAAEIIGSYDRFWVSNCGCREGRGSNCARSRIDVCLQFQGTTAASGSGMREISRADVDAILAEAEDNGLVTRPFRGVEDRSVTEGICFCCDDCCGYFLDRDERCDKGAMIESTDAETCNDCGACIDACYFGARSLDGTRLVVDRDECHGCGLCVDACELDSIHMVARG